MTRDELEEIIFRAGVGSRTAKKLFSAFDRGADSQNTPRPKGRQAKGHGAALPNQQQVPTM